MKKRISWIRVAILVAGMVVLCAVAFTGLLILAPRIRQALAPLVWKTDPAEIARVAGRMAGYDLPEGYVAQKVMSLQGTSTLVITNQNDPNDLILLTDNIIKGSSEDSQASEIIFSQNVDDRRYHTQASGDLSISIKGQPADLTVYTGTDPQGTPVRILIGQFAGYQGDVMLVIVGDEATWNETVVSQFIQSIR